MDRQYTPEELEQKENFLKRSFFAVSIIVLSMISAIPIVGVFYHWSYSLFIIPPIIAGTGVLLSHHIQINKINALKLK